MAEGDVPGGEWRTASSRLTVHLRGLYGRTQATYHAFDDLPRLVDQLRILSVNAELASARAGDYGRAVRVLTHFATEAVSRLLALVPEMVALKTRSYGLAAAILTASLDIGRLESAGSKVLAAGHRFPADDPLDWLDRAWRNRLDTIGAAARELSRAHHNLAEMVATVRSVMMQSEIISTNIAIEATAAGPFEGELTSLADVMRERVDALRAMIDDASRRMRDAAETNLALSSVGGRRGGLGSC
ncbi:MAG: chemotaxis protein [Magnetospirillum sp.]|nr:chemotaxis protein [Magnetospirillum sp.]